MAIRSDSWAEDQRQGQRRPASDSAILSATCVFAGSVDTTTEKTVGKCAQGCANVGSNRIADTAAVLMKVGVAGVVDSGFNAPVSATESQGIGWICLATAHEMDEPLFFMTVR